jgi:AAA+ ATPase superfamily predicted ATPase
MALLVGRQRQSSTLASAIGSSEAELVAVYGRRRVGKTFLVREFFAKDIAFELTGVHGASLRQQLANFATALGIASRAALPLAPPRDWPHAFEQLVSHLESLPRRGRKRVVFLDELPWLALRRSGFLGAVEHFWNAWAVKQRNLVVVVCGSASAWMIRRLLHARGGLHNRVTRRIRLEPFTLAETEEFFTSRSMRTSRYQILELYMALGGIPYYLKQIERGESASTSIDRLCFAPDGPLRDEFSKLYASLFEHSERHEEAVRMLAAKPHGLTRNALLQGIGRTSGGTTSELLEELEECGFIARVPRFGHETKDAVYRLIDEYSLFYLKWIERHRGRAANVWMSKRGSPAWRAWSGYAFEGICLKHVSSLKRSLGIEAVETAESAWRHHAADKSEQGAQIDLLIDRKDGVINLCEMKFSEAEFVIDKRFAGELRNKREAFRRATQTRKALLLTMVTTYGVRDNEHRRELVDKSLEMDALFAR